MLLDARSYPIQQVLEQYLEPKNLAYAMRLWSTHFITQPNISLKRFVDDFYSRQTITTSSYGLYSDLLPAMMSALQARSEFTGEPIDGYELPDYDLAGPSTMSHSAMAAPSPIVAEPESAPRPRNEKFVIFSSFIRQLLNGVHPERREKMLYQNRLALKSTCSPEAAAPLYSWLETDSDYFQHNAIGIEEMTAITHIIYMALCEYQGPVEADRILMKVAGNINDTYPFASLDINELL